MKKLKILLVSYTIPENKMGGGMLLYRHLAQQDSYTVSVLTSNPCEVDADFYRYIPEPRWLSRLKRTRLAIWFHDYTHLIHARLLDRRLIKAAREFEPDVIFTVAETYLSYHAMLLAKKLKLPLVSYFMDWTDYASYQHRWVKPFLDKMYRTLYQQSDLALCISDGMKEELGAHSNAVVIYPIPSQVPEKVVSDGGLCHSFQFTFAGKLAHWYGKMVAEVMELEEREDTLELQVFGMYQQWSESFESHHRSRGVFHGFKPYEELVPIFQQSDAFLLPMGFDADAARIERTSFKTKFLDYLIYRKPVVVWGPEYCTAVKVAKEYDAALCITNPDPRAVIEGMKRVATDAELRKRLVMNIDRMLQGDFGYTQIKKKFDRAIESVI